MVENDNLAAAMESLNETAPATVGTLPPGREAEVMSHPPSLDTNLELRESNPAFGRVITPSQEAQLMATTPSAAPAVNSGQFQVVSVAPNEFKITHSGRDLGGKVLTPTEVPVVLGWLNSLPPD